MDKETKFFRSAKDNKIQCLVCPRLCILGENQRGFCFVRQNKGNKVVLTCYGQTSGLAVDPIEKKPLNHFLPGSRVLSFGTIGCNMGCQFCQNWDISKAKQMESMFEEASPEEIVSYAKSTDSQSVAFTYNDPVIFLEYAVDVAKLCQEAGIKTVAVTAGYICDEPRKEFYRYMDAANVDLKAFSEKFYQKNCAAHLEPVLETLKYIKQKTSTWLEVTNLIIPGENDSPAEIAQMCEWILKELGPDVPLHFSAFHPSYKFMDHFSTPEKTVKEARSMAKQIGLHHVYTGNLHDPEGQSTYCPKCKEEIIRRDGFRVSQIKINQTGSCGHCGEKITGVWSPLRVLE